MAEADINSRNSNWMLAEDKLLDFLSELDDSCSLEPTPQQSLAPITPVSTNGNIRKPRRSQRVDILNARQEMTELHLQLQILQEKDEFLESLKDVRSRSGLDWRLFASHERILLKKANRENGQLRERVDANIKLIQRFLKFVHIHQVEALPKSVQMNHRIVHLDNQAHVYRALQSCLDIRCANQLDSIVNQCNETHIELACKLQTIRWKNYALGDRGAGVDFHESVVVPFGSSYISRAISRNPSLNALEIYKNNYVDKITQEPIPVHLIPRKVTTYIGSTSSDKRLILRRLVNVKHSMILLYEEASSWQSDGNTPPVLVHGSGWALITPVAGHATELSVVHCGGFIQINAMDGSKVRPTDALVKDIVAHTQSLQRSRLATFEEVLI